MKSKYVLVDEKGKIKEKFRGFAGANSMKSYYERMYGTKLKIKKLEDERSNNNNHKN